MAFSLKMQEVLPSLIRVINREKITDFYKAAGILEDILKRKGVGIDGAKWLATLFDELEYPHSTWKPNKNDISTLLGILPDKYKQRISNTVVKDYVPKEEWSKFGKPWAKAKLAFKKSLGKSPVILSEYYGNQLDCSVFLGDITDAMGLSLNDIEDSYEEAYTAIDETIGHDVTLVAIKKILPENSKVKLIDYPNGSNLQDAKYEFIIESDLDRKTVEKKIIGTLRLIGFTVSEN